LFLLLLLLLLANHSAIASLFIHFLWVYLVAFFSHMWIAC